MFRRHFFGSRTTIGIDIQSQEIRFIQLEQSKEKLRILQAKVTPLPKKVIDNGYIEEEKTLKTILKNIAKETKTKGQSAIFAMPAHTLIIKKMSFARGLKKVEQMAEIADHLAIHFPQWAELTYDYVVLNHTETVENILIVAAIQSHLKSFLSVIEETGWRVSAVDIDMYALVRAMRFSLEKPEALQVFVDCESSLARCVMMHDNEVIFHREVSVSEMEEQLRYGFQFCRDHFPSLSVKTLYLSPAASSSLSWMQNMGCVLQTVNPFKKITSTFEPLFPKLFLAFGLALRGCHARN